MDREAELRALYRAHRAHVGAPLGDQSDMVPTTRYDLRELYEAYVDGRIPLPAWARNVIYPKSLRGEELMPGKFCDERCPRCGCTLLFDGSHYWCSFVGGREEKACSFGIDKPVTSLSLGIIKARGGEPPVPFRGFA